MATKLQREAQAFADAKVFLRDLRSAMGYVPTDTLRALRRMALAGNISGAYRELRQALTEAGK